MPGELPSSGPAREVAAVGGRLTDPGRLVHGDPELILAGLDGAASPEELLAAAVYRASGHVHRDAGAGVRRQILAAAPDGRLVVGFGADIAVLAHLPA